MSGGPYLCYRELIPSTSILMATFFKIDKVEYLIAITSSQIHIYRLEKNGKRGRFLFHCANYQIYGRPQDVKVYKTENMDQIIFCSFDFAKFVAFRYSPELNDLDVVYMHNAEEGAVGLASDIHAFPTGRSNHKDMVPFIHVDQNHFLICSVIYGYQLFFIPLAHEGYINCEKSKTIKPFIFDPSIQLKMKGPIIDICFVEGYGNPTVCVLQEPNPLPLGHSAKVQCTCLINVLAVDANTGSCVVLWRKSELPHDSLRVLPIANSGTFLGRVLLVTCNAICVISQEKTQALAFNGFAKTTVSSDILVTAWPFTVGRELYGSRWMEHADGIFFACLASGEILMVRLYVSDNYAVLSDVQYEVDVIANTNMTPSCFCLSDCSNKCTWFLGSVMSDSLLFEVELNKVSGSRLIVRDENNVTSLQTPLRKRTKRMLSVKTPDTHSSSCIDSVSITSMKVEECLYLYGGLDLNADCDYHIECVIRPRDVIPVTSGIFSTSHCSRGTNWIGHIITMIAK